MQESRNFLANFPMGHLPESIAKLPKAELHVHLEGSIRPPVAVQLAARHGVSVTEEEVRQRYAYKNFAEFIEAFKWVTSFLRHPQDFALIASDFAEQLLRQNVVYAEVTLSVGIMILRRQDPLANFAALREATIPFEAKGLYLNWIFDAVRQFGPHAAMEVVSAARRANCDRIVAFGIGGDELSVPTVEFRKVYETAAESGLHRLIHAGEIGGPEKVREAIEILGAERIGHGIAAVQDPSLMDLLTDRRISLEVCPVSNLCTGALARLNGDRAALRQHPLPTLVRHGIPVVLSTDDPSMFHTTLSSEYEQAASMGLSENELRGLVHNGFEYSFLSEAERLSRFPFLTPHP